MSDTKAGGGGAPKHQLRIDFQSGVLIPTCTCGRWAPGPIVALNESLVALHARVEAEHLLHAAEAGGGGGDWELGGEG